MLRNRLICGVIMMILAVQLQAQQVQSFSNKKQKWIVTRLEPVKLDSLSIVPGSLSVPGMDTSWYSVDYLQSLFSWKKQPPADSMFILFRTFPLAFTTVARRMLFDSVLQKFMPTPELSASRSAQKESTFDFGSLTYNGSFGRSLSFGNRQDVVLNSSLNLQLNGYFGDSIRLAAALSDNNIPVQPDGNTQNLNEFDQVFLQFSRNHWKFSIGDIDVRQKQSYFLNFYKRLQGALYEDNVEMGNGKANKLLASGAVAKGKFTRNIFNGLEGNQGPYRLKGANNELFFIVLAGSERIWIDGQLLQRGEDQDYVINYNTAEVTFTPKEMITKDKRIQIEFEYADRNYLNAQLYMSDEFQLSKKWSFRLGAYSNSDSKNAPVHQMLDPLQRQFLSSLGDSIRNAYYPSAVRDTFSSGKILYRKIDTLVNGRPDSAFVYSTDPSQALYSLNFLHVGEGNGNYAVDQSAATNGKLFRWTAPDPSGNKTGSFEPAILLIAPRKQQMLTMGSSYVDSILEIQSEIAFSQLDVNSFSSLHKSNDKGIAAKLSLRYQVPVGANGNRFITDLHAERTGAAFRTIERLRSVEFYRDWGLPVDVGNDGELLLSGGLELESKQKNSLQYTFSGYKRDQGYQATRHSLKYKLQRSGWIINNSADFTRMESADRFGYFVRPVLDMSKQLGKRLKNYRLGVYFTREHNEFRFSKNDSLDKRSFSFDIFKLYIRSPEAANKWGVSMYTRSDKLPAYSKLLSTDKSVNLNGYAELMSNQHHQVRFNATYRKLSVNQNGISLLKPESTILGRTEYMFNLWKGAISGSSLYELGSGQEPRREFSYLEVPASQGEYAWIDYNGDGLQQLSEFEIARFRDQARFIRIFSPTLDFVKASYLQFNYSLLFNPRSALNLSSLKGVSKWLSRIYFQSSLQSGRKNISDGFGQFNPFRRIFIDTSLITMDQLFSNSFSFNRFSSVWGIDINNLRSSGKAFLSYGFESRQLNDWSAKTRIILKKKYTAELVIRKFSNLLQTPGLNNRNFDITGYSIEPRINFTQDTRFRLRTSIKWEQRNNTTGEKSVSQSIHTEVKYNVLSNMAVSSTLTYTGIRFNAASNSAVSYSMLEGLLPGQNLLWNMDITRRLTKFLELTVQYEGRKAGSSGIVHIGRGQIRALF